VDYDVGRQLARRFFIAACLLVASAAGGFIVADYQTRISARDAEITNLAGRQRMLATRIAFLASHADSTEVRTELAERIASMRQGLDQLTLPGSGYLEAAEVRKLCVDNGEQAIRPRVISFLAAAERGEQDVVAALQPALVADIDRAVTAYATFSSHRINLLRAVQATGFALQLIVLWLAWRYIFQPMAKRIGRDVRALEASRNRTRTILDAAGEGICGIDPQGCIIFINDAACRLLGCDRDAGLGANLHTLACHHDADGASVTTDDCPVLKAIAAGEQRRLELDAFWHGDGSRFPVELVIAPLRGRDGFTGAVVVFTDITARRKAAACDQLSTNVLNHINECVFITSQEGIILQVNPAFCVVTGYQPEEALGQTPRLLKSGRHDNAYYRGMWEEIGIRGYWHGEIWNRRKDGEVFCARQTVTAIRDGRGEISHYVSVFRDVTDHKADEEKIRQQAYHDHLTGLPNRNLFMDRLRLALAQARRGGRPLTLMFVDLDRFKEINDRLGHVAGDAVLCAAADALRKSLRDSDTVARLGGDEFIVLLPETPAEDAAKVAEKMLRHIGESRDIAGEAVRIGASIGVALFPKDGDDTESLIRAADVAMYTVKAKGRNGIRFA
jgi:diguanylate cyclase (GGDEF)-like protein/PAS domain S-box-containing protein